MGFEARIKKLILTLLENPVKQMHKQEQTLHNMADTLRQNQRRMHETEFIVSKF